MRGRHSVVGSFQTCQIDMAVAVTAGVVATQWSRACQCCRLKFGKACNGM